MIPTEHEYTVATKAAAKALWATQRHQIVMAARPGSSIPPEDFEALDPLMKVNIMEAVLRVVDAALSALPDRQRLAWSRGHAAGIMDGPHAENPYPPS